MFVFLLPLYSQIFARNNKEIAKWLQLVKIVYGYIKLQACFGSFPSTVPELFFIIWDVLLL